MVWLGRSYLALETVEWGGKESGGSGEEQEKDGPTKVAAGGGLAIDMPLANSK